MNLFTPRISKNSQTRLRMALTDADISACAKSFSDTWRTTVTDQNTGRRYVVESAPCGLRCHCDAVIVKELAHEPTI
jgi:hypothetical protein